MHPQLPGTHQAYRGKTQDGRNAAKLDRITLNESATRQIKSPSGPAAGGNQTPLQGRGLGRRADRDRGYRRKLGAEANGDRAVGGESAAGRRQGGRLTSSAWPCSCSPRRYSAMSPPYGARRSGGGRGRIGVVQAGGE